jgi:hypothetical protein
MTNTDELIEATVIENPSNADGEKFISLNELQAILNDRPIALLCNAVEKIDSNQAKLRSLYRSQLFVESEYINSDLGIADGSDCELIQVISDELKAIKELIEKALSHLPSQAKS